MIQVGLVVVDEHQQRDAAVDGGPQGMSAHQKIAIAQKGAGRTSNVLHGQRHAHLNRRAGADATAAVLAEISARRAEGPDIAPSLVEDLDQIMDDHGCGGGKTQIGRRHLLEHHVGAIIQRLIKTDIDDFGLGGRYAREGDTKIRATASFVSIFQKGDHLHRFQILTLL